MNSDLYRAILLISFMIGWVFLSFVFIGEHSFLLAPVAIIGGSFAGTFFMVNVLAKIHVKKGSLITPCNGETKWDKHVITYGECEKCGYGVSIGLLFH